MSAPGESTYWNGEPTPARKVRVVVGPSQLPTWWCAKLAGTEREAVEVSYGSDVFYLDNEDESAWGKVTEGRGLPRYGHRSLPVSRVIEPTPARHPQCSAHYCCGGRVPCYVDGISPPSDEPREIDISVPAALAGTIVAVLAEIGVCEQSPAIADDTRLRNTEDEVVRKLAATAIIELQRREALEANAGTLRLET